LDARDTVRRGRDHGDPGLSRARQSHRRADRSGIAFRCACDRAVGLDLHGVHFSRFTIVTAALFALATVFAYGCDRGLHMPALAISILVAVLYPAASYVIHSLWTFADQRRGKTDRA
jgi:hypothetical protein